MLKKLLITLFSLIFFSTSLMSANINAVYEKSIVKCISDYIFLNECSGKIKKLTWWNKGESFPSFGIGHFIWFPASVEEPYQESFPELIDYYRLRSVKLPEWLDKLSPFYVPWPNRAEFFKKINQKRLSELRYFLNETRDIQIAFIILRLRRTIPLLTFEQSENNRTQIEHKISQLLSTSRGIFALTDYINFKGDGTVLKERYQQQGWGALQVIEAMVVPSTAEEATALFSQAANKILLRRIDNAPDEKNEKQYLKGWQNRLESYKTFKCN
ncbi:MAG: hypothetical protein HOD92_08530 [Deltaproteobacteria bacterium]|nr:hypothetical protein [Deltaproteobacteria bacterium]